jgi:prepilin-type N-terminal cleavage/methylation domain-containing protein
VNHGLSTWHGFLTRAQAKTRVENPCHGMRRGLTFVELLIALAISAILLTATAVCTDASFRAYQVNQEQSTLIQRARIALNRMTTVIRTTTAHSPDSPVPASLFASGQTVTDTGIDLYDDTATLTIFRYDAANKRLLAIVGGKTFELLDGVQSFQIKLEPMRSPASIRTGGGWDLLMRATILMTIRSSVDSNAPGETTGTQVLAMSASVMPRRNVW